MYRVTNYRKNFIWNITYKCNLSCVHCFIKNELRNNHKDISDEEIEIILNKFYLIRDQIRELNLSGGEPLMSPHFEKVVRFCGEAKIPYTINTNGLCWSDRNLKLIENYPPVGITVSLDGSSPGSYLSMRGIDGFMKVIETVRKFNIIRSKINRNFYIDMIFVLTKLNKDDINSIGILARNENIDTLIIARFTSITGNAWINRKKLLLPIDELIKCADKIYEYKSKLESKNFHIITPWLTQRYQIYFHRKYKIPYSTPYIGCLAITSEFSITPKGNILPCFNAVEFLKPEHGNILAADDIKLSLLHHTFPEILELDYFFNFAHKLHRSRTEIDYDICKKCSFREICNPCPTMRLLLKKDETIDICYHFDRMIKEKII